MVILDGLTSKVKPASLMVIICSNYWILEVQHTGIIRDTTNQHSGQNHNQQKLW